MELAQIGATPAGGVRRLALTDEDRLGRDWLKHQAQAAGLAVSIDAVGNMYLRRAGKVDMPPVLIGSHIDTQPSGGKFDGAFGVLAGLEVCRVLAEQHILTELPIEVVAWTNEEGSRFLPVMAGSGVYAGVYDAETVLDARASDGARFGDELARIGYTGIAGLVSRPAAAYLEVHIEQGPILEAQDRAIGAVRGALGQVWFEVEIIGYEAHAGPTPMERRKDALQAAAEIISGVEAIGRIHPEARATVGMISVWPNSRNVIPGQAKFSVDLRHPDQSGCNDMSGRFLALVEEVSSRRGVDASLKKTIRQSDQEPGFIIEIELITEAARPPRHIQGISNDARCLQVCLQIHPLHRRLRARSHHKRDNRSGEKDIGCRPFKQALDQTNQTTQLIALILGHTP